MGAAWLMETDNQRTKCRLFSSINVQCNQSPDEICLNCWPNRKPSSWQAVCDQHHTAEITSDSVVSEVAWKLTGWFWSIFWLINSVWHLHSWTRAVLVIFSTVHLKVGGFFPAAFLTGLALVEQINHGHATFLLEFLSPPGGKYLITHFLSSTDTPRPGQEGD